MEIDSIRMELRLPQEKLQKLQNELRFFELKKRATKRQLQRLVGILAHCGRVIRGSRTFSCRIIDMLCQLPDRNVRIKLSEGFLKDISWWKRFAENFNGVACIVESETMDSPIILSDASLKGYSVMWGEDWTAGFFNTDKEPLDVSSCKKEHCHWINISVPRTHSDNINVLETTPILLAVNKYSYLWENKVVIW